LSSLIGSIKSCSNFMSAV